MGDTQFRLRAYRVVVAAPLRDRLFVIGQRALMFGHNLLRRDKRWAFCKLRSRDSILQVVEIQEGICLPAEFVGNHGRRFSEQTGNYRHENASSLQSFDKPAKISIARKQKDFINELRHFHRIYSQFNSHATLCAAPALSIAVISAVLRADAEAVIGEPIEQRPDGAVFINILRNGRVEISAHHRTASLKFVEQALEVHIEVQCFRCVVKTLSVNENSRFAIGHKNNSPQMGHPQKFRLKFLKSSEEGYHR
jgi:hypothetical protein